MGALSNDDPDDDSTVDFYIDVSSDGRYVHVNDTFDNFYVAPVGFQNNITMSSINMDYSANGNFQDAFWIVDSISDAARYFLYNHAFPQPLVKVNWENGMNPRDFPNGGSGTGSVYRDGEIYLDGRPGDSNQRFTILHEYGHHIMFNEYERYPPTTNCSPHSVSGISDEGCAWSEGWADFVPSLVDNESPYQWFEDRQIDLEAGRTIYDNGTVRNTASTMHNGMPIGQEVEGRVASALWDIKDSNEDATHDILDGTNHDELFEGDNEIVNIFLQQPQNFNDFDDRWNRAYDSKPTLDIMKLHGMDFYTVQYSGVFNRVLNSGGNYYMF